MLKQFVDNDSQSSTGVGTVNSIAPELGPRRRSPDSHIGMARRATPVHIRPRGSSLDAIRAAYGMHSGQVRFTDLRTQRWCPPDTHATSSADALCGGRTAVG